MTSPLARTHVTETSGLRQGLIDAIDALIPALPGGPEQYVTPGGRLDIAQVQHPPQPHSHSTQYAADLITELWTCRGALPGMIGHAGSHKRAMLTRALTMLALDLDPQVTCNIAAAYEEHHR